MLERVEGEGRGAKASSCHLWAAVASQQLQGLPSCLSRPRPLQALSGDHGL